MNIKNYIEKYKKKSLWSKITDVIFIIFILVMLTPAGRLGVGGFVNRIRAYIIPPSVKSAKDIIKLSENSYNWQLKNSENLSVNFADFKGKVIFLNFWATWCPPCVGEMPEIQKLYDKYKDNSDIQFLLVTNEPIQKATDFVNKRNYSFPIYTSDTKSPAVFQSNAIPVTFIISKTGEIMVRETGATNWSGDRTQKLINKLINK
ncbi:MAG: TlpA family protein disulfide reductase [Bacteroidetes bacterium]|nr:MAG: TlpA family protein disulfide reductase [Bacteroidota bacterium]